MKTFNLAIIFLLFFAGIFKTQTLSSQNRFEAAQETLEFKITTWNTEWLSCSQNGPTDEQLQINNVVAVIKSISPDVLALQEVGTSDLYTTIDTIVRKLGSEWGGSIVVSTKDNCYQNQGIIYKKSRVILQSASFITNGGTSSDWSGGRYPALYNIELIAGNTTIPVALINIHAKAFNDAPSYSRRKSASLALKTLLDGSSYNTKKIILLGDFNDYLTGTQCSSCSPAESPYKNFVDDTQNFKCLTTALYDPAYSSPVIDNIIISNELIDSYKNNSTQREESATQVISNYRNTTSDHVPVSAIFSTTVAGEPTCESLAVSETFAQSLGNFTPYSVSGLQTWYWRQAYGACASGFYNLVNNDNEDWLISPVYDLSGKNSATFKFNHAINFSQVENDKLTNHTLWASLNYSDGALPSSVTWTQLTIPTMASGNSWMYVSSGNVEIPAQFLKKDVRIAFKYLSNVNTASTWEIRELTLNATCTSTNIDLEKAKPQTSINVVGKLIKVTNQQLLPVAVYDITGRILFSAPVVQQIEIPIFQSGVYIVRAGNQVSKVVVSRD